MPAMKTNQTFRTQTVTTEERTPAYTRVYGTAPGLPRWSRLMLWPAVTLLAVAAVAAAILFAVPQVRTAAGYVIAAVLSFAAAAVVGWRRLHAYGQSWEGKMAAVAAQGVVFAGDLVLAAGPQLVVAKVLQEAKVAVTRKGVFIGGRPLGRVAPFDVASWVRQEFGAAPDVMVAVGGEQQPMMVPTGKRQVWLVSTDDLPSAILGAPARLDDSPTKEAFRRFADRWGM